MTEEFDAIVIGAGEARSVVASKAVAAGKRVALLYREPYGSTCLNTGRVPSKFLIQRARVAQVARTAARFHVHATEPRVDLGRIVHQKGVMIAEHRQKSLQNAQAAANLTLLAGAARFASPHEVEVAGRRLRSERIFIATGMRPFLPRIDGLERVPALTNESLMELTAVPEHLVIVGGGYVACDLGQTFRRYGSAITIIQSRDHLCPNEEADVSTILEQVFEAEGIEVVLGHGAVRVEPVSAGRRVVARSERGGDRAFRGSHLLVAAGRRPNTDILGLDTAGVEVDEKGVVRVDDALRTNVPGVWAIGDVNGQQPFTRICQEEGKVAFANAFEGAQIRMERRFLGYAVSTDPAIGSVGLTELVAREQGHEVMVGLVTFDQVEKARLMGETAGLIKYVAERATHQILGCHVIGPNAENLIYDAILVMRHGGTLEEFAPAVGIFPTLQEGMEGTARGLLRRLAPNSVSGPLVTGPVEPQRAQPRRKAVANTTQPSGTLSCPACGAELDTREGIERVKDGINRQTERR